MTIHTSIADAPATSARVLYPQGSKKNILCFVRRLALVQMALGVLGCCLAIAMGYLLERSMGQALTGLATFNQTVSQQAEDTRRFIDEQQKMLGSLATTLYETNIVITNTESYIEKTFSFSEDVVGIVSRVVNTTNDAIQGMGQLVNWQMTLVGKSIHPFSSAKPIIDSLAGKVAGIKSTLESQNADFQAFHEQLLHGTGASINESLVRATEAVENLRNDQLPALAKSLGEAQGGFSEIDHALVNSRWAFLIVTGITGVLSLLFLVNGLSFWLVLSADKTVPNVPAPQNSLG